VTTAPAPTNAYAPTVTPGSTVAFAPIVAPSSIRVGAKACLRSTAARGVRTLVNTADGPTNTSRPSVTPS
jgi:hypothetical protein